MSVGTYERLMRTIRKMEPGTMGGQSKVATPPANIVQVLSSSQPSPPSTSPAGPFRIFASGTQVLSGTDAIQWDEATMEAACGIGFEASGTFSLITLPAGTYPDGLTTSITWDTASGGNPRKVWIRIYDLDFNTVAQNDPDATASTADTIVATLGSFTVPTPSGYAEIIGIRGSAPVGTISELSYVEIPCL